MKSAGLPVFVVLDEDLARELHEDVLLLEVNVLDSQISPGLGVVLLVGGSAQLGSLEKCIVVKL